MFREINLDLIELSSSCVLDITVQIVSFLWYDTVQNICKSWKIGVWCDCHRCYITPNWHPVMQFTSNTFTYSFFCHIWDIWPLRRQVQPEFHPSHLAVAKKIQIFSSERKLSAWMQNIVSHHWKFLSDLH